MAIDNEKELFLGLGTNTGEREKNMTEAIERLSLRFGIPIAQSEVIESEAWGYDSPNKYLNGVILFRTSLPPTEILNITEEIERELGRKQKTLNGNYCDRPIDIDILFYGNECIDTPRLTIPHRLLHKRLFVLEPLAGIAPQFIHPILEKSIGQLLDELREAQEE